MKLGGWGGKMEVVADKQSKKSARNRLIVGGSMVYRY